MMQNAEVKDIPSIQFDSNRVKTDPEEVLNVLKTYQAWPDYTWNDGTQYFSFLKRNWNNIDSVFIEKSWLWTLRTYYNEIDKSAKNIAIFKVETETQNNLNTMQTTNTVQSMTYNFNSQADAERYLSALDQIQFKTLVDTYLEKYEKLSKWIVGAEWNDEDRKRLKRTLKDNIRSLRRMKGSIERKERRGFQYEDLTTFKSRLWELIYYYSSYENVCQTIELWWDTSWIHQIIDSLRDAKRAKKNEKMAAKRQERMNDVLMDGAVLASQNRIWEQLEENLETSINWAPMSVISNQNMNWYTYVTSGGSRQNGGLWNRCCRQKWLWFPRKFGERFSNMLEQIFPDWMNRDPRQKEAWTNVWSLLAIWWAIFTWYKTIKSLQKKNEKWEKDKNWEREWWKAFLWWAATLGIINSDTLIQVVEDAIGWHPAERSRVVTDLFTKYWFSEEDANRLSTLPIATLSALHFIPIYELKRNSILQEDNWWIAFNYHNYENYINSQSFSPKQKQSLLEYWRKINDGTTVPLWLSTFWINTIEDLNRIMNWDVTMTLWDAPQIQTSINEYKEQIENWVNAELYKHWLIAKDPTALKTITTEYNAEKDTTGIHNLIIRWMTTDWLLELVDAKNKGYTLKEMVSKHPDELNLDTMTMVWFKNPTNEVKFSTYKELFDVVYMTEKIKRNFEWRPANPGDSTPFHVDEISWNVEFNNTKWYEILKNETTIVRNWKDRKDLTTLLANKKFYADYLNAWWQTTAEFTNYTSYPETQNLGIKFYNEEDVEKTEILLKKIKDDYSDIFWDPSWKPFKTDFWGNLIFKDLSGHEYTVDGELYKIKTIFYNEGNKQKFLDFLNNKDNWMYKSST